MPAQVTLTITKGNNKGREYVFDDHEVVIVGRGRDCGIKLTEDTVSRYHCMLEITPPLVVAHDIGSRNGTFLNDELMGRRPDAMSAEDGRGLKYTEFAVDSGDKLRFGEACEITVRIYAPALCCDCSGELSEDPADNFTVEPNIVVCKNCWSSYDTEDAVLRAKVVSGPAKNAARHRKAAPAISRETGAERGQGHAMHTVTAECGPRECQFCDTVFISNRRTARICPGCKAQPEFVVEQLLLQAMGATVTADLRKIRGYKIIDKLGRGGMGKVWLVKEEATGELMALKLMLPQMAVHERKRQRFLREAGLCRQFEHPNVVRQYKYGSEGDSFFLMQEVCAGGSVDDMMEREGGRLDVNTATHIILQVLDCLIYIHKAPVEVSLATGKVKTAKGVVHRDLKPSNILLMDTSKRPVVKVADFGLAKAYETAGLTNGTLTGEVAGQPFFMSVKQIENYRYAKPEVDVWAAAACYYFMLTGEYPKRFNSKIKNVWLAALGGIPVPIDDRDVEVPKRLAAVIDKALQETPCFGVRSASVLKEMILEALRPVKRFDGQYEFGGKVDIGRVRSENQDEVITCPNENFFAVCDGMGGLSGGGQTAAMLAGMLPEMIVRINDEAAPDADAESCAALLARSVADISDHIYTTSNRGKAVLFGATICGVWLVADKAIFVNIGDSRGYILSKGDEVARQITVDHNLAQMMVEQGRISREEARVHSKSATLTGFAGMPAPARVDLFVEPIRAGDKILLCSDGLYGMADDREITSLLAADYDADRLCATLVERANSNGGMDNISVVVLDIFC